jgi:Rap1a immunity proteins
MESKMKKLLTTAATLIALAVPTLPAQAGTVNDWLAYCNGNNKGSKDTQFTYCYAYTRAVADTAMTWERHEESKLFCIPPEATSDQLVAIARKYISANPEKRHYNASFILAESFHVAFPCEDKSEPKTSRGNKDRGA